MHNIVLVIHLILAVLLIGAVLLQRSEGGALGMGGGGNVMSGRGAATALQKATWGLVVGFLATSLILTIFATQEARDAGLLDQPTAIEGQPASEGDGAGGDAEPFKPVLPNLPSLDEPSQDQGSAGDGSQPSNAQ